MRGQKLILNLLPIQAGGGLQNACSFIASGMLAGWEVHARGLPSIREAARTGGVSLHVNPAKIAARLMSELGLVRRAEKGTTCFTFFGPPPLFSKGHLINVVGCAYSNLFYPEIDFWQGHEGLARWKKALIDRYRRWSIARADYWIFETDAIARRAVERFSFPAERVFVVRMAPSRLVLDAAVPEVFPELPSDRFLTLYLASGHPNKRIDALIDVAQLMREQGDTRCGFVLTLPPESAYAMRLFERIGKLGLDAYFFNVGAVRPEQVASLIRRCDAMCNLARLESFSNNFVEAWTMRKPLLVTDADWAHASCGQGAIYVRPEQPESVCDALYRLVEQPGFGATVAARGAGVLGTYPTAQQKAGHYLDIIGRRDLSAYRGACVWRESV